METEKHLLREYKGCKIYEEPRIGDSAIRHSLLVVEFEGQENDVDLFDPNIPDEVNKAIQRAKEWINVKLSGQDVADTPDATANKTSLNSVEEEKPKKKARKKVAKDEPIVAPAEILEELPKPEVAEGVENQSEDTDLGNNSKKDEESPVRTCRVCGCTDNDCRHCIEKTGHPCHWVEEDLCSACVEEPKISVNDSRASASVPETEVIFDHSSNNNNDMNFFQQLAAAGDVDMTLRIFIKDGSVTMSLDPGTKSKIKPLNFAGTPQEMDEGFFKEVFPGVNEVKALASNLEEVKKELKEKVEKKQAAKSESKPPAKKKSAAKPAAKKKPAGKSAKKSAAKKTVKPSTKPAAEPKKELKKETATVQQPVVVEEPSLFA